MAIFPGEPESAGCPSCHQPSVSKHWREHKALILTSGLASSFFIHNRTPDRRSVAPFMLALRCQYHVANYQHIYKYSVITSSSAIAERQRDTLSQLNAAFSCCTTVRKITFGYKDCPFMWYKNINGSFFRLVTKHACYLSEARCKWFAYGPAAIP